MVENILAENFWRCNGIGPKFAYDLVREKPTTEEKAMYNLTVLEENFKKYVNNLSGWLPEDIVYVDLPLLQELDLLDYENPDKIDPQLTQYFHVVESLEKITLINDEFVIWIVPEVQGNVQMTYTMIALNNSKKPELEMAFVTEGTYNQSKLILRILEKYLYEIRENQELFEQFDEEEEA